MLDGLILNRTPHVRLFNEIKPSKSQPVNAVEAFKSSYNFISSVKSGFSRQEIYNSGAIMETIAKDKRVLGFAPKITAQVFFNDGAIDITGVINGIDVQAESKLFFFNDYIIAGSSMDIKNISNSIVLGKDLAEKLGKTEAEISKWLSGTHNFTLRSLAKIEIVLNETIIKIPSQKIFHLKVSGNNRAYLIFTL